MKVTNYTSWNIETKLMTLVTYTSRFRKLHLKLLTLPTCSDGRNRGAAHCTKVWGPCYFSLLSGRDSLVPLELVCKGDTACGSWHHMKPIPDEMIIQKANLWWNLPDQMFIHNEHWWWNLPDQMSIHKANLRWNLPDQIFIHKVNLWWNLPDQIFIHKANLQWDLPDQMSIHKANLQ